MTELADTLTLRSSGRAESRPTLGSILEGADARRNAFDTIRLLAAMSVIVSHSFPITLGNNNFEPIYLISGGQTTAGGIAVAVFFIISGLFISRSFEKNPVIGDFAKKRAKRILPALIAFTVIFAFIIGPALTNLSLREYFSDRRTWSFLKNALLLPSDYILPGVFSDHPEKAVNGSLWSLKFEVMCYMASVAILLLKLHQRHLLMALWAMSFVITRYYSNVNFGTGAEFYMSMFAAMFRYFGAGMLMYLYRDRIKLSAPFAIFGTLITIASIATPYFSESIAIFGSYSVITFGYFAPSWMCSITKHGDISYGVYIYGWPVQQLVWPIGAQTAFHWLFNCALALLLALGLGAASWFLIEKPALRM